MKTTNFVFTLAFIRNDLRRNSMNDPLPPFLSCTHDPNLASCFREEIDDLGFTQRVGSPKCQTKLPFAIEDFVKFPRGIKQNLLRCGVVDKLAF